MAWCEANDVEFLFGLAQNSRLNAEIAADLAAAAETSVATGEPARRFKDFKYRTLDSWSRERRVIGKAEWMTPSVAEAADPTQLRKKKAKKTRKAKAVAAPPAICLPGRANPRFIVTSLKAAEHEARALREALLRARRDGEPYQGMSTRPVRRSDILAHDARQSTAPLACFVRIRVDERANSTESLIFPDSLGAEF